MLRARIAAYVNEVKLSKLVSNEIPLVVECALHSVILGGFVTFIVNKASGLCETAEEGSITPLIAQTICPRGLIPTFSTQFGRCTMASIGVVEAMPLK
jgi:hypothetical protein